MPYSMFIAPAFFPEDGARNLQYTLNRTFSDLYAENPTASYIYPLTEVCLTTESSAGAIGSVDTNSVVINSMMGAVAKTVGLTAPIITLDSTASATGGMTPSIAATINTWARNFRSTSGVSGEGYLLSLDFVNGVYRV